MLHFNVHHQPRQFMKKSIILSSLFLAIAAHAAQPILFQFRDGTALRAKVHTGGQWGPTARGVVLKVGDGVYFHDYPSSSDSLAPPVHESDANPFGLPSCTPSRISFKHFKPFTLRALNDSFGRLPRSSMADAQRGISAALQTPDRFYAKSSVNLAALWQLSVEREMGTHFRSGRAIWGKHVRLKTTPANTLQAPLQTRVMPSQPTVSPLGLPVYTPPSRAFNTTYSASPARPQTQPNRAVSLNPALQLPARRMAWTTGSGNQNRLDLNYRGSSAQAIRLVFGQPDLVQDSWWGYQGMQITDYPSTRRYTIAWFGFKVGKVSVVRIDN